MRRPTGASLIYSSRSSCRPHFCRFPERVSTKPRPTSSSKVSPLASSSCSRSLLLAALIFNKAFYKGELRFESQFALIFNNATFLGYPIISSTLVSRASFHTAASLSPLILRSFPMASIFSSARSRRNYFLVLSRIQTSSPSCSAWFYSSPASAFRVSLWTPRNLPATPRPRSQSFVLASCLSHANFKSSSKNGASPLRLPFSSLSAQSCHYASY